MGNTGIRFKGVTVATRWKHTYESGNHDLDNKIDRARDLVPCSECGALWREEMLDCCVGCGLGGKSSTTTLEWADEDDGATGICPNCMRTHYCGGSAQS